MRVICGLVWPDDGTVELNGGTVAADRFSPNFARENGIRIVHQELSLCSNLTVAENFMLEEPPLGRVPAPGWRGRFRARAQQQLASVFPASELPLDAPLEALPIGQRQMIEIARAAAGEELRMLVLDEPTSSLDAERSAKLRAWIRARSAEGVAFVFISHKLHEILDVADRIVVMCNGRIVWDGPAAHTTAPDLVERMGGHPAQAVTAVPAALSSRTASGEPLVRVDQARTGLDGCLPLGGGEIVGLAGLDGNGQRAFLHDVLRAGRRGRHDGIACGSEPSFVSGDRRGEGVFPLWSVLANIAVGASVRRNLLGVISQADERRAVAPWLEKLRIASSRLDSNILDLSGGNQQKVLAARALMQGASIVLLDDPTRGVDVEAKQDFYRLVREIAAAGALVIWYSTEDAELLECSRVLVFRAGRIARELGGDEITEEAIVTSSFGQGPAAETGRRGRAEARASVAAWATRLAPAASLLVVLLAMVALNPEAGTPFGLDLLLGAAVPVVLVALGQMFVIGGSEIDLGIGPFAGLASVISATVLVEHPLLGAGLLAAALLLYASMGLLIQVRRMPAIVVTLGASFFWVGCGYTLQATPGGSCPAWLGAIFDWHLPGVPTSAVLIAVAAGVAYVIDSSRIGVILRGFGNDERAVRQAGWSGPRYALLRYLISGYFAAAAGLSLTAINTASDINAGASFTLLSIAAVVIGGCRLLGGSTAPLGVTCGAVTLSLIGALLGFLGISTDFNAAVQGALLLVILGSRAALERIPRP